MRYIIILLLVLHGAIHVLGTAKAFNWANIPQLSKEVTKTNGVLWMGTALLFIAAAVMLLLKKDIWWLPCGLAIILSQVLVIGSWTDAKFGTILNVVLLVSVVIGFANWHYYRQYQLDVVAYLPKESIAKEELLTEADMEHLPEVVQRYIRYSGSVGKPKVSNFRVEISGEIRQDEESEWMPFTSVQYNFLDSTARLFFMEATMKKLPVKGYHKFLAGRAIMDIRLLSLLKVQYEEGEKMDISETVTFFNDMCCMAPATLIDRRIKWFDVDSNKVRAAFSNNGITISAWLYFNGDGALINFVSEDRYATTDKHTMVRLPWATPLKEYKDFNGYTLPGYADLIYTYPDREMCYGRFYLNKITYNNNRFVNR